MGDSALNSELVQLLLGRCLHTGTAVLQQLSRTQGGLWSVPKASKDRSRERARDLVWDLHYRGVVGDPLVSLTGGGARQMESRRDEV